MMNMKKIVQLEEMEQIIAELKIKGFKIVHCHGVYDLLHPGHIKHFEAAKRFGDVLVVTITADKFVNKGPGRPVFNETIRSESIAALESVDYVAINFNPYATTAIEAIKPDFYVKGQDYSKLEDDFTKGIYIEKDKTEEFGGQLVFTNEIQFSSSKLINTFYSGQNDDFKQYLLAVKERFSFNKVLADIDSLANLTVTVIGEIIIDEYQFVMPLGKSAKSATITARLLNKEVYAGGVLAVANHVADFVKEVHVITFLGSDNKEYYLDTIRPIMKPNVRLDFIELSDRPTILKKRYIDTVYKKHKLLELVDINDSPLDKNAKTEVCEKIAAASKISDLLIVSDFGHGFIDRELATYIESLKLFVALNTQTNSSNFGFNLLTKYKKCNYFAIDKNEAKLATHNKQDDEEKLMRSLIKKMGCHLAAITLGTEGCIVGKGENYARSPVFTTEIVDTIGAGDAFLSITSLLAFKNTEIDEIAFIGNAVGAMAVRIMGNKSFIGKVSLLKYIKTLLV